MASLNIGFILFATSLVSSEPIGKRQVCFGLGCTETPLLYTLPPYLPIHHPAPLTPHLLPPFTAPFLPQVGPLFGHDIGYGSFPFPVLPPAFLPPPIPEPTVIVPYIPPPLPEPLPMLPLPPLPHFRARRSTSDDCAKETISESHSVPVPLPEHVPTPLPASAPFVPLPLPPPAFYPLPAPPPLKIFSEHLSTTPANTKLAPAPVPCPTYLETAPLPSPVVLPHPAPTPVTESSHIPAASLPLPLTPVPCRAFHSPASVPCPEKAFHLPTPVNFLPPPAPLPPPPPPLLPLPFAPGAYPPHLFPASDSDCNTGEVIHTPSTTYHGFMKK